MLSLLAALLASTLLASPSGLWVAGPTGGDCGGPELLAALGNLRPRLALHTGLAPVGSTEPQVILERAPGLFTLRITGNGEPLVRSFVDTGDCASVGRTAALIVDRTLDELPPAAPTPDLQAFIPTSWLQMAVAAGGGAEQGMLGWSAAVDVEGVVHLGSAELLLGIDLIPSSSEHLKNMVEGSAGSYQATCLGGELGAGWAPRLGPGRLAMDGTIGEGAAFVSLSGLSNTAGAFLYQQHLQPAAEPFIGARVGYSLDLPHGLFLGVRVEERLAWVSASLQVEGSTGPIDSISTRSWTLNTGALLGWRFY